MNEDRLIDIEEAAKILCTSEDYLYRAWRRLPFAMKLSRKQLRFSEQGIYKYITQKQNEGSTLDKETANGRESVPTR